MRNGPSARCSLHCYSIWPLVSYHAGLTLLFPEFTAPIVQRDSTCRLSRPAEFCSIWCFDICHFVFIFLSSVPTNICRPYGPQRRLLEPLECISLLHIVVRCCVLHKGAYRTRYFRALVDANDSCSSGRHVALRTYGGCLQTRLTATSWANYAQQRLASRSTIRSFLYFFWSCCSDPLRFVWRLQRHGSRGTGLRE